QKTVWLYGVTTAGGSGVNSNDLLREVWHPDKTSGAPSPAERDQYTVNALGEVVTAQDRNGTVHTFSYDVLGRPIADTVTTLSPGVDGLVRRLETNYDSAGRPYRFNSFDAPAGGNVVNQVQRGYNGLGQLTAEWQAHAGSVTGGTPVVQYAYRQLAGGA